MNRRYKLLLHPIFIVSVFILFINDHILKYNFHNFLTGKLSDFFGLFSFTIFLYVIFGNYINSNNSKKLLCLFSGLFFILLQLPFLVSLIPISEINLTPDYSDLVALIVLPFSYYYIIKTPNKIVINKRLNNIIIYTIIVFSSFTFLATSVASYSSIKLNESISNNTSTDELLFIFEETLINSSFTIDNRSYHDSTYIYHISTDKDLGITEPENYFFIDLTGRIYISTNIDQDTLQIEKIYFFAYGLETFPDSIAEQLSQQYIIKPFKKRIAKRFDNDK